MKAVIICGPTGAGKSRLALNLAENKDQLTSYRKNIYDNILKTPLFDSKKFTENFQNLILSLS